MVRNQPRCGARASLAGAALAGRCRRIEWVSLCDDSQGFLPSARYRTDDRGCACRSQHLFRCDARQNAAIGRHHSQRQSGRYRGRLCRRQSSGRWLHVHQSQAAGRAQGTRARRHQPATPTAGASHGGERDDDTAAGLAHRHPPRRQHDSVHAQERQLRRPATMDDQAGRGAEAAT